MTAEPSVIVINTTDPAARKLWTTIVDIANHLSDHDVKWCLVGGLMVALYALEAGQRQRATTDIDLLGDARQRPSATETLTEQIEALGGTLKQITGTDSELGYKFEVAGQEIDILAPDGLGSAAATTGGLRTVGIPGGTQALTRSEEVQIEIDGRRARLRRPTLLGAILLKARSLEVHHRPQDQRQDLVTLLSLVTDPRTAAADMSGNERRWLRRIEGRLALDDDQLSALFDPAQLRVARAAFRRLSP